MSFELAKAETLSAAPSANDDVPTGLACLVIVARKHGMHLTPSQLIHDNMLSGGELGTAELVKCADNSGMTARVVRLDFDGLTHLRKALPAIVRLKDGSWMILSRVENDDENHQGVMLRDPS